jgi:hypothetical protein
MVSFKRVREYVSQPYEHPGEGRLVQKLGKSFIKKNFRRKLRSQAVG